MDTAISVTNRRALRIAALIVLVSMIAALGLQLAHISTETLAFQLKNKDFANYWLGGRLALSGDASVLFARQGVYFKEMKAIFGADYPYHNWSYPPHALFLLMPFGVLDFLPSMVLFLGITLALFVLALGTLPARWQLMSAILLLPFVVADIVATQNGFFTAALMIGGLALRDRRPIVAGMLFGILTFKPQIGVLLPILLLYERQWRVIGVAVVTATVLVLASILAFGPDCWYGFFVNVAPEQTEVMNTLGGDFPFMITSAFGSARALGLYAAVAMQVHAPFAIAGIVLFAIGLLRLRDGWARAFATLLATFLIVPYSVAYDLGAVAAFAALWPLGDRAAPNQMLRILLILLAVLPIAMMPLGQAGLPVAPVVLLATLLVFLKAEGAFAAVRDASSSPPKPSR